MKIKKQSPVTTPLLSLLASMLLLTGCGLFKPSIVIPADRQIKFDGTNYIVPPAEMLDIMNRLDLKATNQ